jgi:FkbM family methyltransferase
MNHIKYKLTLKTRHKITIAKTLYTSIISLRKVVGLGPVVVVHRRGIQWKLDLSEGIDLSIYLLGSFEPRTLRIIESLVKRDDMVLDIGANIGAHTLHIARLVGPNGRVFAFEPTNYAFTKLLENRSLNPLLAPSIVAEQVMLVDSPSTPVAREIFSSWPLVGSEKRHPEHLGVSKSTTGARSMTLDEYVEHNGIRRLSLIKLDVDGNEPTVLTGAQQTMKQFQPVFVIELAPYLHSEESGIFESMVELFFSRGYVMNDIGSGKRLPLDPLQIRRCIPNGSSINIIVRPHV